MQTFFSWLESRMDDYANQSFADELNSRGINKHNASQHGFKPINPNSEQGYRMSLPGDYVVVGRDDAYAMFNADSGQWHSLPRQHMPMGGEVQTLGHNVNKIPNVRSPKQYDTFSPTSPENPAYSPHDSATTGGDDYSIAYDRPKLRKRTV